MAEPNFPGHPPRPFLSRKFQSHELSNQTPSALSLLEEFVLRWIAAPLSFRRFLWMRLLWTPINRQRSRGST